MLVVDFPVVMIVTEQPVVVFCLFFNLLQKVCQPVRFVVPRSGKGDARRGAVGDDVIYLPAD